MNRQLVASSACALAIIGGLAGVLTHIDHNQRLGLPGVKTHPLPESIRLQADLPARVLDFESKEMQIDDLSISILPADTSFGFRRYKAPDGFTVDLRVVLMGKDRASLHKPQFCLTGQGWRIDESASAETTIRVNRPVPYELPVVKIVARSTAIIDGQSRPINVLEVYWYVADNRLSGSATGSELMWSMASQMLRTGVLQRWSCVSCLVTCLPGQESASYERLKQFIAAAVPQFQLYPRSETFSVRR